MTRAKTKVPAHPFVVAPDLSDPRTGVTVCGRCALVGQAGDSHHTMPDPVADARSVAAGEKN